MDRFTGSDNGHAYFTECFEEPCLGMGCVNVDCEIKNLTCQRLAKYEDIGLKPEQLTEIDKLYAEKCREVAELKERQSWIPVDEQLPKLDEDGYAYVLVCMDDEFVATTDYTRDGGFSLWADSGDVIAWMPLPEPYKAE